MLQGGCIEFSSPDNIKEPKLFGYMTVELGTFLFLLSYKLKTVWFGIDNCRGRMERTCDEEGKKEDEDKLPSTEIYKETTNKP